MVRKSIAVLLLVLAASPLTAPFQTYDIGDGRPASEACAAVITVTSMTDAFDPGSVVAPLSTPYGRLKILLDLHSGLIATHVIVPVPLRALAHSLPAPPSPPGVWSSHSSTVLRL